jgi:hypothetical protein
MKFLNETAGKTMRGRIRTYTLGIISRRIKFKNQINSRSRWF